MLFHKKREIFCVHHHKFTTSTLHPTPNTQKWFPTTVPPPTSSPSPPAPQSRTKTPQPILGTDSTSPLQPILALPLRPDHRPLHPTSGIEARQKICEAKDAFGGNETTTLLKTVITEDTWSISHAMSSVLSFSISY